MTRSIFGWDLPTGVTLNDIDRLDEPVVEISDEEDAIADAADGEAYGYEDPFLPNYGEEEISTTGALNAIINDPLADVEESGLTGKPYESDETPITPEEAQEVIEEMRKAVSSDGTISLARAFADELGLEVATWAESLEMSEDTAAQMFEESQFVPSRDLFKEDFNQQYELALKIGNARFGSECKHTHTLNGRCINCFRSVVTL